MDDVDLGKGSIDGAGPTSTTFLCVYVPSSSDDDTNCGNSEFLGILCLSGGSLMDHLPSHNVQHILPQTVIRKPTDLEAPNFKSDWQVPWRRRNVAPLEGSRQNDAPRDGFTAC